MIDCRPGEQNHCSTKKGVERQLDYTVFEKHSKNSHFNQFWKRAHKSTFLGILVIAKKWDFSVVLLYVTISITMKLGGDVHKILHHGTSRRPDILVHTQSLSLLPSPLLTASAARHSSAGITDEWPRSYVEWFFLNKSIKVLDAPTLILDISR